MPRDSVESRAAIESAAYDDALNDFMSMLDGSFVWLGCDYCGYTFPALDWPNYCPRCGMEMGGEFFVQ